MNSMKNILRLVALVCIYPFTVMMPIFVLISLTEGKQSEAIAGAVVSALTIALVWWLHKKPSQSQHQTDNHIKLTGVVDRTNELTANNQDLQHQLESAASEKRELEIKVKHLETELSKKDISSPTPGNNSDPELLENMKSLAQHYIKDMSNEISNRISYNNLDSSKRKMEAVFIKCDDSGVGLSDQAKGRVFDAFREKFKDAVRKEEAREEQRRIKEQIREEQRSQREYEKEVDRIRREEVAIQRAIKEAIAKTKDEHSDEVERLRAKLTEAESRMQRAKSMAEITKAGHVYVISNVGSFGENVYKVGMTRRLEPMDRVKELGDASVPFPFDVHMMISSDDAPSLEKCASQGTKWFTS